MHKLLAQFGDMLLGMSRYVLVPRNAQDIRAALAETSPLEAVRFEADLRTAQAECDDDLDLRRLERVLDRWWGRLHLRLNPPKAAEIAAVRQLARGDFRGFSAPPST